MDHRRSTSELKRHAVNYYNIISERDLVEAGRAVVEKYQKRDGRQSVDTSQGKHCRKPLQPMKL
ncbi:MAG: hypothetical protein P0120_00740 [Nitrospira sp.]|nr:hypothetical protein [Nitrospira sp.]